MKILLFILLIPYFSHSMVDPDNSNDMPIDIEIHPEEQQELCKFIQEVYFEESHETFHIVQPHCRKRMQRSHDPMCFQERAGVYTLRKFYAGELIDVDQLKIINKMIMDSTTEAIKKQENKKSKRLAIICAAAAGLLGTTITSAVALIIHFTTQ